MRKYIFSNIVLVCMCIHVCVLCLCVYVYTCAYICASINSFEISPLQDIILTVCLCVCVHAHQLQYTITVLVLLNHVCVRLLHTR